MDPKILRQLPQANPAVIDVLPLRKTEIEAGEACG